MGPLLLEAGGAVGHMGENAGHGSQEKEKGDYRQHRQGGHDFSESAHAEAPGNWVSGIGFYFTRMRVPGMIAVGKRPFRSLIFWTVVRYLTEMSHRLSPGFTT